MTYDRDIRDHLATDAPETNHLSANPRAEQILPGTPIFDVAGEKIGEVSEAGFTDGLLNAHRSGVSGIFSRDIAIPMDAIARTDAGGVHLNVTKDELRDRGGDLTGKPGSTPPPASPASGVQRRPNDMATDAGSPHADLDVPPPNER